MKVIGVIGGISPESTMSYYKGINAAVRQVLGGQHSAELLLSSVDFGLFCDLKAKGDWETQGALLAVAAQNLERGGADFIILATNTMHKVADRVAAAVNIPFLHIGDATAQRITAQGLKHVGLLATKYTMEMDFYKDRMAMSGIDVTVPQGAVAARVSEIIYDELCMGQILQHSKIFYQQVIADLAANGAQGVVFGCTEIGLLLNGGDVDIPVFDTTEIHIEAAVQQALAA